MTDMDVIFATHNKNKLKELKELLPASGYAVCSLSDIGFSDEIDETGDTIEENAMIKAKAVADFCKDRPDGFAVLADDTGLFVDALGGEPGVYSARYSGENATYADNNAKLLSKLADVPDAQRTACFRTAVACVFDNGDGFIANGECKGMILRENRGENGFGYDPLFYSFDLGKTFAEATSEEKNRVSHRAAAMRKAAELLEKAVRKSK